jgi:hypothetical protein
MKNDITPTPERDLRQLSSSDFVALGTPDLAYVKQVTVSDQAMWSIHAADGAHLGLATDRDVAFATLKQHDMEPCSVH